MAAIWAKPLTKRILAESALDAFLEADDSDINLRSHDSRLAFLEYIFSQLIANGSVTALDKARLCIATAADLTKDDADEAARESVYLEIMAGLAEIGIERQKAAEAEPVNPTTNTEDTETPEQRGRWRNPNRDDHE